MKKELLSLLIVTLTFTLAGQSQGRTEQSKATQSKKASSLTGCLSKGSEGTFTLVNDEHTVEVKSSDSLADHAGHKVKLEGKYQKNTPGTEGGGKGMVFNATKVEDVSDSCDTPSPKP